MPHAGPADLGDHVAPARAERVGNAAAVRVDAAADFLQPRARGADEADVPPAHGVGEPERHAATMAVPQSGPITSTPCRAASCLRRVPARGARCR